MDTFLYVPADGAVEVTDVEVASVKFGGGYEQRFATDINYVKQTWSLRFLRVRNDPIDAAYAFLKGRIDTFLWTPPGEVAARKFYCKKVTKSHGDGNAFPVLSVTFEETFE